MDNLNLIADPLNKKLMQGRRNTLICMNPNTPKNQIVVILHFRDEESCSKRLTSNGELHGSYSFGAKRLSSSIITHGQTRLDLFFFLTIYRSRQRVRQDRLS